MAKALGGGPPVAGAPTRIEALTGFAHPAWAAFAPNGQLDFSLIEAIRQTLQPNPRWLGALGNHNRQIAQGALEESRKRAAMVAQSNAEIARIRASVWEAQQESADRRARQFGDLIRGVNTYVAPQAPGGTVEQSASFGHVWRLSDGTYALTNDVGFDPWRDLRIEGQKLEMRQ
jgi:hypothetical protein